MAILNAFNTKSLTKNYEKGIHTIQIINFHILGVNPLTGKSD